MYSYIFDKSRNTAFVDSLSVVFFISSITTTPMRNSLCRTPPSVAATPMPHYSPKETSFFAYLQHPLHNYLFRTPFNGHIWQLYTLSAGLLSAGLFSAGPSMTDCLSWTVSGGPFLLGDALCRTSQAGPSLLDPLRTILSTRTSSITDSSMLAWLFSWKILEQTTTDNSWSVDSELLPELADVPDGLQKHLEVRGRAHR